MEQRAQKSRAHIALDNLWGSSAVCTLLSVVCFVAVGREYPDVGALWGWALYGVGWAPALVAAAWSLSTRRPFGVVGVFASLLLAVCGVTNAATRLWLT